MIAFLIIVAIFVPFFVTTVFGGDIHDSLSHRRYEKRKMLNGRAPNKAIEPKKERSPAANNVIRAFNALPPEHRPAVNIVESVEALDIKYGIKSVDQHFIDKDMTVYRGRSYFSWQCSCQVDPRSRIRSFSVYIKGANCKKYPEYMEFNDLIASIDKAVKEQQHALEVAGVQSALDDIDHIRQTLRAEQELVKSVTAELTQGR